MYQRLMWQWSWAAIVAILVAGPAYAQRSRRGPVPGAPGASPKQQEYQGLIGRARAIGPRLKSPSAAERQRAARQWAAMKADLHRWAAMHNVRLTTVTLVDGQRYRGAVQSESRVRFEFDLSKADALRSETAEIDGKTCTFKSAYASGGKLQCDYECPEDEPKDPNPPKRPRGR